MNDIEAPPDPHAPGGSTAMSGWSSPARPLVVLAGIATVWIAVRSPDPVVAEDYYRRGVEINKTLAAQQAKALMPALQGRNHAATPPLPASP